MGKQSLTIRVSPDLFEELDDWRESRGYSRSEAGRRLLRRQLRDEHRIDELKDRVADLEARVEDLERRPWWWPG